MPQLYERSLKRHLAQTRALAKGKPPAWPFTPLGRWQDFIFFRDSAGIVQAIACSRLNRRRIAELLGSDVALAARLWPAPGARGWSHQRAAEQIIVAAGACGIHEPETFGFTPIYRLPRGSLHVRVLLVRLHPKTAAPASAARAPISTPSQEAVVPCR